MAFRELMEGLRLPDGATARYRKLEALGRMLTGELYEDLLYPFGMDSQGQKKYIPLLERRPSSDFNLAWEITQDTFSSLFGDEQFPAIKLIQGGEEVDAAEQVLSDLVEDLDLETVMQEVYEEGVVGSVAVVVHRSDEGTPFYDVLPGKWCEPVYRSATSKTLSALCVTYMIDAEEAQARGTDLDDKENKGKDVFWYRYVVGPFEIVEYIPLPDSKFSRLGQKEDNGEVIEFKEHKNYDHGFKGRTPVVYIKNLGGKQRDMDGTCLWWPTRNMMVEIDYTLSQAARGLRYAADPRLFVKLGELDFAGGDAQGVGPGLQDGGLGGMSTHDDEQGKPVSGVTNTIVGHGQYADAKILETSAQGIKEEREHVRDLREYVLEVLGGSKMRAEHVKGVDSGPAIDKTGKPLNRLIRRQRRPYGNDGLLPIIDLTVYGVTIGALDIPGFDPESLPAGARRVLDWPNDNVLQGKELLDHITGCQLAAGGSLQQPLQLESPETMGAKIAADIGLHKPYSLIKGNLEATPPPVDPNKPTTPPGSGSNASSS